MNLLFTVYLFLGGPCPPSTPSTTCLQSPLEDITHLEDTHAEGIAQDLVSLIVVAIANVCGCNEELKGVILL